LDKPALLSSQVVCYAEDFIEATNHREMIYERAQLAPRIKAPLKVFQQSLQR
jgi:hypothetical protein